jgi:hypothetical protein
VNPTRQRPHTAAELQLRARLPIGIAGNGARTSSSTRLIGKLENHTRASDRTIAAIGYLNDQKLSQCSSDPASLIVARKHSDLRRLAVARERQVLATARDRDHGKSKQQGKSEPIHNSRHTSEGAEVIETKPACTLNGTEFTAKAARKKGPGSQQCKLLKGHILVGTKANEDR